MAEQILTLYRKYRQGILYLFFGGLTTVVNYVVYIACFYLLPVTSTTVPNVIAWIISVLFAYLTNRIYVFQSDAHKAAELLREIIAFAGARVFTLIMETIILRIAVDTLGLNNLIMKLLSNILVILLNYVFSRFWIFKKNSKDAFDN